MNPTDRHLLATITVLVVVIAVCQISLLVDRLRSRRRFRKIIEDAGSGR